jgi:dTDP-4-dehydrorhamnose 3,5-epimerase
MKFERLPLPGCWLIVPEMHVDERGSFARVFCEREFSAAGIPFASSQFNLSSNKRRGTLRGMHLQLAPHAETKIVRCTRGRIYDVILDLRVDSPTYQQWHAVELTADGQVAVLIPEGCAHGFQSLEDGTDVFYQMSSEYQPTSATGVRWNDPAFKIAWPILPPKVNQRDASFPDYIAGTRG